MHYFYIIYSDKIDRFYYGSSHDPEVRIILHNSGATPSTMSGIPWSLVYLEIFETKREAIKKEKEIKKIKSRKFVESLIIKNNSDDLLSRWRDKCSSQLS